MKLLNNEWFNLVQNPDEKKMDLIIVERWIEVKLDEYAQYSWNFYIEFECNWKPSGLFRPEEIELRYWAHSDGVDLYLLDWAMLKSWVKGKIDDCNKNKSLTSRGTKLIEAGGNWWRTKWLVVPLTIIKGLASNVYPISQKGEK